MNKRTRTDAMDVFMTNRTRTHAFLRIFDQTGGPGQPSNDRKELLRGAVVFAVGSLDSYLHDLVLEVVPQSGPKSPAPSEALRSIAKDDPSLALRVVLAGKPDAARSEFRAALDEWLSKKSFQGPEAVLRAASYVGATLDWKALDASTSVNTAERLEHYTAMRNEIVHRGRRPYIKRANAQTCADLTHLVVVHVDSLTLALHQ